MADQNQISNSVHDDNNQFITASSEEGGVVRKGKGLKKKMKERMKEKRDVPR